MRTDRLLSIIIYLLNHDTVSAARLAERFGVSKRTILRDIETLSLAGIPVRSLPGAKGGYSIMEGFKLDGRLVGAEDRASIITALEGFLSAYGGLRCKEALEKVSSMLPGRPNRHLFLDFGAAGENSAIQAKLKALEKAIEDRRAVQISYENAKGEASSRTIEPVALNYRWYAWYLLAYCQKRRDYRVFKLARIGGLEPAGTLFTQEHGDPAALLDEAFAGAGRTELGVTLLCRAEAEIPVCEYLGGTITETLDNGDFIMRLYAPENERMWYAILLSFGDKVTVIEPEALRARLVKTAEEIVEHYKKQ